MAHFQGRPDEAERELALLATKARSDAERARIAIVRFDNSYLLRGRADQQLLDDVADVLTDPFWHDEVTSRRSFAASFSGGPRVAVEAARTGFSAPAQDRSPSRT